MATPNEVPLWARDRSQSFRQKAPLVVKKAARAMGIKPNRYAEQRHGRLVRAVFWDNRRVGETVLRR